METLLQDISYTFKTLLKKPAFTLVVLLTLAVGIGANSAIFSVINTILLRPLPYKEPSRIIEIWESSPKLGFPRFGASVPNYLDWKSQSKSFENIAAFRYNRFTLTGQKEPEYIRGGLVSTDLFKLLGMAPALGRDFLPSDDQANANPVVILSHALWERSFGSNANIVSQTIILNDRAYTVVGVMPPDFKFPPKITVAGQTFAPADLWAPLIIQGTQPSRGSHNLHQVIGRLKEGVSIERAQSELKTIAAQLESSYPDTNKDWSVDLVPMHEQMTGDVRTSLLVLLGTVSLVLLIACVNVANLLLARSTSRVKEMAIRSALGASPKRLIRQLLTESLSLSMIGGILGLLLAYWVISLLLSIGPPESIPRTDEISMDSKVLGFTLILSLLTGIIFGLAPALHSAKPNLVESLKEGIKAMNVKFSRGGVRHLLVVTEVALALVLLISAGLLIKSFVYLTSIDTGFDKSPALTMQINLPSAKYADPPKIRAFYEGLMAQVASLPGVKSVGATSNLPLSGNILFLRFFIEGRDAASNQVRDAGVRVVTSSYFETMGIRLLKGRFLNGQDHDKAARVAVISEAMSHRFFPDESPIGKRLMLDDGENTWREIVGVVANVKQSSIEAEAGPEIYLSNLQDPVALMTIVARGPSNPNALTPPIRSEINKLDNSLAPYNVKTTDELLSLSLSKKRFSASLLGLLAALAFALAAVGIYSVTSYIVNQRTHEIGIRMSLGARPGDVVILVIKQGMATVLIGVAIGLIAAFLLTRLLATLLFGISTTDPLTFGLASLSLILVAMLANCIPALRATRVDPIIALRRD